MLFHRWRTMHRVFGSNEKASLMNSTNYFERLQLAAETMPHCLANHREEVRQYRRHDIKTPREKSTSK